MSSPPASNSVSRVAVYDFAIDETRILRSEESLQDGPFRMAVQWVNRPNLDFRGYSGWISSGCVEPGDAIRVVSSGRTSTVRQIMTLAGALDEAVAGQSVTLTFADEVDCSRGDVVAAANDPMQLADQFEAAIVWMDETEMLPGRPYWLKIGAQTVSATVHPLKYKINVNSMKHLAAKTLDLNAVGVANITTDRRIPFEPYVENRNFGAFILIDKLTNATVAAGMIHFALQRSESYWQESQITREHHARTKHQKAAVLWLTGLSGAGKSALAKLVEKKLAGMNRHTFLLDGDNIRRGSSKNLGFTDAERVEGVRRVGEVARLMTDAGLIVITDFTWSVRAERSLVRQMMEPDEFFEIFVDTLEQAEARDVKGLDQTAGSGKLKNFSGIDRAYEEPESPELRIDTTKMSLDQAAEAVVALLVL